MKSAKKRIMAIAPAWNEAGKIGKAVASVPRDLVDLVVVVDDGSSDNGPEEAREHGAIVIQHAHNKGVGAAIRTGIEHAIHEGYDIVVVFSGGGKTPGEQMPQLVQPILEEGYDFVQGSRYVNGGELQNAPLHRRFGTKAYSFLFTLFARHKITDGSSGFRAFKTELFRDKRINLWQDWLNTYELEPYLYFKVLRLGYKVKEAPISILYPQNKNVSYTKMRFFVDWWKIFRPVLFLGIGLKK